MARQHAASWTAACAAWRFRDKSGRYFPSALGRPGVVSTYTDSSGGRGYGNRCDVNGFAGTSLGEPRAVVLFGVNR